MYKFNTRIRHLGNIYCQFNEIKIVLINFERLLKKKNQETPLLGGSVLAQKFPWGLRPRSLHALGVNVVDDQIEKWCFIVSHFQTRSFFKKCYVLTTAVALNSIRQLDDSLGASRHFELNAIFKKWSFFYLNLTVDILTW